MAIQIIDGFQVNTASPIDNRIVASGSAARNAIPYKYHGLRVFDISNNTPYVWNGSTWINENTSGISGMGSSLYFPLFNTSNSIMDSLMYQDGGIIKTADDGGGDGLVEISPYYGSVTVQGGFYGNGSNITNINASNITSGTLTLNRLTNSSNGWLLSGSTGQPTYINPSQVSVGTSSVATQSTITNTTSNTNNYVTFVSNTSGSNQVRVNSTGLLYNPGTNVLTTGTVSANGIKFPNTQIPSADPNTLDDYEEGTWTPTISGITSGFTYTSSGFYVKVGKIMFVGGYIKYTTISTSVFGAENNYISVSNIPYISGMPVQSASVGSWSINPSTGTVQNRFFNTGGVYNMDNGAVIASYQASTNPNIYFSSNSGANPLSGLGYSINQVVSFSLTFIPS